MKATLIVTIGTRDLMFQVSSDSWFNIGDDRVQNDIISEQAEVVGDLGLPEEQYLSQYREITHYLMQDIDQYRDRIKPVIIGKLLNGKAAEIGKIYLIGTNQNPEVKQRDKDTLYAAEIIQDWLRCHYPDISSEVIHLGTDGTNPSDFEAMFRWCRNLWQKTVQVEPDQPIWVCLKGGVGQASEALRISGLSRYGDGIQFFEFYQNTKKNREGIPSDYTGPFLGTNYLWDRTQQQVLGMLERYDYAGAEDLLKPYFQQDSSGFSVVPTLIKAGIAWNQGEFETFFSRAKGSLPTSAQRQQENWWWMAYEQAQLGLIRLEQGNTTEAMLHSYRAVEGLLWKWAANTFPDDVIAKADQYLSLKKSICNQYSALEHCFKMNGEKQYEIPLRRKEMQTLLSVAIPEAGRNPDYKSFWSKKAQTTRDNLSHRLGGITERELFKAWGEDIHNLEKWSSRVLNCLNLVTGQPFNSLEKASLFAKIHPLVVEKITTYQP